MSRHRILLTVLTLVFAFALAGIAFAQVSQNYDLRWSVLSGGGAADGQQSPNYRSQDTLGQWAVGTSASSNYRIVAGFWPAAPGGTPVPTGTASPTPTRTPTAAVGDAYETDNSCAQAREIPVTGAAQTHTFHVAGDVDWVKFNAATVKTYIIQIANTGARADPVLMLFDNCSDAPLESEHNAFGTTVKLEWDVATPGWYYLKMQQHDPSVAGAGTNYDISVAMDTVPPAAPANPRCGSVNMTTLGLQWQQSTERDVVKYVISYHNDAWTDSGAKDIADPTTTYAEIGLLQSSQLYHMSIRAQDFSGLTSPPSSEVSCMTINPPDTSVPTVVVQLPTTHATYTTTLSALNLSGTANDSGGNLSRVKVRNTSTGSEVWDYGLAGSSHAFAVQNLGLKAGQNTIQVTAYDNANNASSSATLTVQRMGQSLGAVIVMSGHNESYGLQNNIDNIVNRAYRIFQGAGYDDDHIYYLAPYSQDADGDGGSEVDGTSTAANLQSAITTWAAQYVGPGKPLHIYLMDHGLVEGFCANGCASGQLSPDALNTALNTLESSTGVDEINVFIEACHSGSFMDRLGGAGSVSKLHRVIITSTGRDNNAYASAQGAYFSDALLTCIASSGNLRTCFEQARAAVQITGVNQTPWLDDNGDAVSNSGDGPIAQSRYVTHFFGAAPPQVVTATVEIKGNSGTVATQIQVGNDPIELVWADIYPPTFHEPSGTTLNLGIPSLQLDPVSGQPGVYRALYPNGFTEPGTYRVIIYAQDRLGLLAQPRLATQGQGQYIYLPAVLKRN